jgi:beta-glucosidase
VAEQLLGHGLAARALRGILPSGTPVGITYDMHPVRVPDGVMPTEALELARTATDAELNGLFLEPVLHGRYPVHARASLVPGPELIADGDFDLISQPVDFIGVNYYSPVYLRPGDPADLRRYEEPARCELPGVVEYRPGDLRRTPMGWLVDPEGLYDLLMQVSKEAPGLPLYVTENGCAAEDYVDPAGLVNDTDRIDYLHGHLEAAARAISAGANLAGYYVWSLLDNFEWGWGFQRRFGVIFIDFETQRRIPKQSAAFYASVVRANAVPPLG